MLESLVTGELATLLAGDADVSGALTLDHPTVLSLVKYLLAKQRPTLLTY